MATDEHEEEREFLAGLKARTGRDLAEWMASITAQGFADKNETIDWLREQGLPFARASWLERIHRNGGKAIYSDPPPKRAHDKSGNAGPQHAHANEPTEAVPRPPTPAASAVPAPAPSDEASLEKLLAAAKGYRPLYHLLEAEMRSLVPALAIMPRAGYVSFGAPAEFAVLTLHATELRLGLDLGERPFDPLLQKAKLKGPGAVITHMAVLTDARQVNAELLAAIKAACVRVNG
ncbi:MAG: DUF4287 domain-containing protein [Hyphomonadaceae bacterium]|jgi:hypothetical protein|nr:DUF4287 domain-containing protein [Hyphomonadaceae bacterium]